MFNFIWKSEQNGDSFWYYDFETGEFKVTASLDERCPVYEHIKEDVDLFNLKYQMMSRGLPRFGLKSFNGLLANVGSGIDLFIGHDKEDYVVTFNIDDSQVNVKTMEGEYINGVDLSRKFVEEKIPFVVAKLVMLDQNFRTRVLSYLMNASGLKVLGY